MGRVAVRRNLMKTNKFFNDGFEKIEASEMGSARRYFATIMWLVCIWGFVCWPFIAVFVLLSNLPSGLPWWAWWSALIICLGGGLLGGAYWLVFLFVDEFDDTKNDV